MDLSEYVTMDEGVEKLVSDLEERGVIVTPARLEQILDEREGRIRTSSREYQRIGQRFPDLNDPDSELAKAAYDEFDRLTEERPDLKNEVGFELAVSRAAQSIGYAPQKAGKKPPADAGSRDRLRLAHGGPASRGGGGLQQPVTLTDAERKDARKMGISEKDALDAKRQVIAQNAKQKRAS
jgi:hypothetical protein